MSSHNCFKSITKVASFIIVFLVVFTPLLLFKFISPAFAATSPTLGESSLYSVLGGAAVTNVGTTTTDGAVGVSPGTSIRGVL